MEQRGCRDAGSTLLGRFKTSRRPRNLPALSIVP